MAFNPQATYRGDIHQFAGMQALAGGIGQLGDELKKIKEENKKREQEDRELTQKLKVFTKDQPVDLTGMTLDDKKGVYAGLLERENSQVNQSLIGHRNAQVRALAEEAKMASQQNDAWRAFMQDVSQDPNVDLTPFQQQAAKHGINLGAAANARMAQEQGRATPSEQIDAKNALLRERELVDRINERDAPVEVHEIQPGLLLIRDKNGARVQTNPNKPPQPTTDMKDAEYLNKLIQSGKYEDAARFANVKRMPKEGEFGESGGSWSADDFKPKKEDEAPAPMPTKKAYNIGGTTFTVK